MSLAYQNLIDEHACPTAKLNKYIEVQAQTVAPEVEVDSAHDPEFGELYRVWRSYHLLKRKMVVVGALALLVYPSFSMPAQANPITAPQCKDIPSCGVAGIVISTEIVAGVLYYLVKNAAGGVYRVRAKQQLPAHSNQQYGEEFSINDHAARCHSMAEEETRKTGRRWRVLRNLPVRGTGLLYGKKKLQWECTITDAPEEN